MLWCLLSFWPVAGSMAVRFLLLGGLEGVEDLMVGFGGLLLRLGFRLV